MEHWEAVEWVAALFALALVLGIGEVLTPFFGLSVLAVACLIGAHVIAFRDGDALGLMTVGATVVGVPGFLAAYIKWFPKTAIGRSLMPPRPEAGIGDAVPHLEILESLEGRVGRTVTMLRPVGACEIDGRRIDCQADSGFIESGRPVRVVLVQGNRVVVRPM